MKGFWKIDRDFITEKYSLAKEMTDEEVFRFLKKYILAIIKDKIEMKVEDAKKTPNSIRQKKQIRSMITDEKIADYLMMITFDTWDKYHHGNRINTLAWKYLPGDEVYSMQREKDMLYRDFSP